MTPTDTNAAVDFLSRVFGPATSDPVFVCSLPNAEAKDREPGERRLMSRDMADLAAFATRWDRKDRGLFFCVSTLKPGAQSEKSGGSPRCEANASEMAILHADVDSKDITIGLDAALAIVRTLPCPPSIVVRSGNGLHLYWLLSENALDNVEDVKAILRQLADLVGGDLSVAEVVRLMRVPGSHNTKKGTWRPVSVAEADYSRVYHLPQIEDMLAICGPMIRRKEAAERPSRGAETNPFLAVAARFGFKPPIDVEQHLSAMALSGPAGTSIHETQLRVSASLLTRGTPVDEVVGIIIEATRAASGEYGERWNWRREEREIRAMCDGWLRKNPTVKAMPRAVDRRSDETRSEEVATGTAGAVVRIEQAREKKARPRQANTEAADLPVIVADGVVEAIRAAGQDILLTEGEVFLYADGVWHAMTPADQQWIQTLIQEGFEALGKPAKSNNLNATWKRLVEHPGLFRRSVEWDAGDYVVTQNGMLDVSKGAFSQHDPGAYSRRKIGAAFVDGARCPLFVQFVESLFADRELAERGQFVATIQSFMGAALAVHLLSREERKALILVGPSRTGKTELSRVIRMLIGNPIATPSVAEISERFGLASLYDAAAWIRDDAINEGDDLDPQRFKTIVTGEPIDIERKHRDAVRGCELNIPVLLTTNALPKARDRSDAMFNRSLIIEMTNVVSEEIAHAMRKGLGVPRGSSIGGHIFSVEAPGILNWAVEGLRRLLEHGSYQLPDSIRASIQRFKDDNNPVGEWTRVAVVRKVYGKVSRHDLLCAYHGWQKEQDGDDARALGGRAFWPRFRSAAPWADPDICDDKGRRWVSGVGLTDEGLHLWERHNETPLKSGSKGTSLTRSEVNRQFEPRTRDGDTHF